MRSGILARSATKARPNVELKRQRERCGLSQARLAALAGCSQGDIAKLETGAKRTTADWATKLAPHLGIGPQALFPGPETERDMRSNSGTNPGKLLLLAMAVARRLASLHGAEGREDVIANLGAPIYDVLVERNSRNPLALSEDEAAALVEAILRRLWRPPSP